MIAVNNYFVSLVIRFVYVCTFVVPYFVLKGEFVPLSNFNFTICNILHHFETLSNIMQQI